MMGLYFLSKLIAFLRFSVGKASLPNLISSYLYSFVNYFYGSSSYVYKVSKTIIFLIFGVLYLDLGDFIFFSFLLILKITLVL